jgi:hypothetical protein
MSRPSLRNLLAAALLTVAACGAPSSLDICHSSCDANKRCGVSTDAQAANCHTDCDAKRGQFQDQDTADDKRCKNAGDVRKQFLSCSGMECNKINTCAQLVDNTCVAR